MRSLPHRHVLFRIFNIAGHAIEETLQRMRAGDAQKSTRGVVRVDVSDGMLLEIVQMSFQPFSGADQAGLLTIPCRIDDRALWTPAPLIDFAQSPRLLEHSHHATERIACPIHPGIMMIS